MKQFLEKPLVRILQRRRGPTTSRAILTNASSKSLRGVSTAASVQPSLTVPSVAQAVDITHRHLGTPPESLTDDLSKGFVYRKFFEGKLQQKKDDRTYRVFRNLNRVISSSPTLARYIDESNIESEKLVSVWSSNDYLCMSKNPHVTSAVKAAIELYGISAGGSRNIAGHNEPVRALESALASFHGKDAALVFSSGYVAGSEALGVLARLLPDMVFLSDAENHASMIAGMRRTRSRASGQQSNIIVWKHNDVGDLELKLRALPQDKPKVVAFESVYSMSGDIAPVREIVRLSKTYGALTFLDEVHGVGLYGPHGGGVNEHLDWELQRRLKSERSSNNRTIGRASETKPLRDDIDIISGTMGKSFGTYGGYIASSPEIVDTIRSFAPGFIFTLALPPAIMAGGSASVSYVQSHPGASKARANVARTSRFLKRLLDDYDIPVTRNPSHIVPVLVGDAQDAMKAAELLLDEHGVYVTPVCYPSVEYGDERLRISPTAGHGEKECVQLASALDLVWSQLGLKRKAHWEQSGRSLGDNIDMMWTVEQIRDAERMSETYSVV